MEKKNTIVVLVFIFAFLFGRQLFAIDQKSTSETAANVTLNIVSGGTTSYSIVYGAAGGTVAQNNATQLAAAIKSATGCTITPKRMPAHRERTKLSLGPSNARPECASMNSTLGEFGYRIAISGQNDNNGNGCQPHGSGTQTFRSGHIEKYTIGRKWIFEI